MSEKSVRDLLGRLGELGITVPEMYHNLLLPPEEADLISRLVETDQGIVDPADGKMYMVGGDHMAIGNNYIPPIIQVASHGELVPVYGIRHYLHDLAKLGIRVPKEYEGLKLQLDPGDAMLLLRLELMPNGRAKDPRSGKEYIIEGAQNHDAGIYILPIREVPPNLATILDDFEIVSQYSDLFGGKSARERRAELDGQLEEVGGSWEGLVSKMKAFYTGGIYGNYNKERYTVNDGFGTVQGELQPCMVGSCNSQDKIFSGGRTLVTDKDSGLELFINGATIHMAEAHHLLQVRQLSGKYPSENGFGIEANLFYQHFMR